MNFQRTIRVPTSPPRSFVIEKVTGEVEFDFEKDRVKSTQDLTVKKPLGVLYNNFRKIFPNSVFDRLKIVNLDVTGQKDNILRVTSQIMSSTGKFAYIVHIVIRRNDSKDRWSLRHKGEIKCSCPAFKYWVAHSDILTHNFYGKPSQWNLVRNMYKNPELIPGMCKHIAFLMNEMIVGGVIIP